MTEPTRVRPRYISPTTGDSLALEDAVLRDVRESQSGVIEICVPKGSGKSHAIAWLQEILPQSIIAGQNDTPDPDPNVGRDECVLMEVDEHSLAHPRRIQRYNLAPWGTDEIIEYCLAAHPDLCPDLPQRLLASPDIELLNGRAELHSLVISEYAQDTTLDGVIPAIRRRLDRLTQCSVRRLPQYHTFIGKHAQGKSRESADKEDDELNRLCRHRSVNAVGIALVFSDALNNGNTEPLKAIEMWQDDRTINLLIGILATFVSESGQETLASALRQEEQLQIHPVCATLLHRLDPAWRPSSSRRAWLCQARLANAVWPRVNLRRSELVRTDLSNAELNEAILARSTLRAARFTGASLQNCILSAISAEEADFTRANLSGSRGGHADFSGASFRNATINKGAFIRGKFDQADFTEAVLCSTRFYDSTFLLTVFDNVDLSGADFARSVLLDADLSSARLDHTRFSEAELNGANLEDVAFAEACFTNAVIRNAHMTGSVMPNADFRFARLSGAFLADIRWPGANLRHASLRNATFHMGSSRSGLVNSNLASEGTRTGFYTDDYDDHLFRSPEEIRAADLTGCDLRDADIDGVDFWRVDLRGAQYSPSQRDQLIATGAILD